MEISKRTLTKNSLKFVLRLASEWVARWITRKWIRDKYYSTLEQGISIFKSDEVSKEIFGEKIFFIWAASGDPPIPVNSTYRMDLGFLGRHLAAKEHERLSIDEPVAVITQIPNQITGNQIDVHYIVSKFSEVKALRLAGIPPPVIGTGALVCCSDNQSVLVMRRSPHTATHPNQYHVFGGAFKPPTEVDSHDRDDLERTMIREVFEEELGLEGEVSEATIRPLIPDTYMLNFESELGYLGIHWLGVDIPSELIFKIRGSSEGRIEEIPISQFVNHLTENKWVPMGLQTILYWLSIGAPISGGLSFFKDEQQPRELLKKFLNNKNISFNTVDQIIEEIPSPKKLLN